jgi:hypothetical protein
LECIVVIIGICLCLIERRYLSGRNGVRSKGYLLGVPKSANEIGPYLLITNAVENSAA